MFQVRYPGRAKLNTFEMRGDGNSLSAAAVCVCMCAAVMFMRKITWQRCIFWENRGNQRIYQKNLKLSAADMYRWKLSSQEPCSMTCSIGMHAHSLTHTHKNRMHTKSIAVEGTS